MGNPRVGLALGMAASRSSNYVTRTFYFYFALLQFCFIFRQVLCVATKMTIKLRLTSFTREVQAENGACCSLPHHP